MTDRYATLRLLLLLWAPVPLLVGGLLWATWRGHKWQFSLGAALVATTFVAVVLGKLRAFVE